MDEVRLIDGNAIENELREFAAQIFVGCNRTTTDSEEAVHTCADMVNEAPTIDPEDLLPQWRKTAEDPPTKEDGDIIGNVLTVGYYFHITEGGKWIVATVPFDIVAEHPDKYSLWMPTPKTPNLPAPENGGIIIL